MENIECIWEYQRVFPQTPPPNPGQNLVVKYTLQSL